MKYIVHTIEMGDVEDPYLYAGFPISEWQQTEMGRWVMENVMKVQFGKLPCQHRN